MPVPIKRALLIVFILFLVVNVVHAENHTDSYSNLTDQIDSLEDGNLNLTSSYQFNNDTDSEDGVVIEKNITVNGNNHYIDGNSKARGFLINPNCNVVIENLTFRNCFSENNGGAIFLSSNSSLTLRNCIFQSNKVYNANGAAVFSQSSTNTDVYGCTFSNNVCIRESSLQWEQFKKGMGSALCVSIGSNLKLHDSVFKSNNAYLSTVIVISYGESRYQLSTLYVRGCLFENNTSRTNTAIYLDELGKCEILDSKFRNNVATFSGGIVTFDASIQAIVKNCLFESNNAVKGGAIYMHPFNGSPSNVLIRDCVFSKNHASISGGAIYANAANLEIVNTNFNRNSASDNGGAIFTYNGATKIASSYFNGNSAQFGGAANLLSNSIAVSGSVFNNNAASKKGGGVYSKTIQVSSSNCRYINNRAPVAGTVYGAFKVTVKQTCKYFGGVKLSIKLSSPWKVSLAQKIKLKFTRGAKTYKTGWIKTSARGVLNLKVPVDLKCGKYSLTVSAQSGVCYINPITITVIKAPVKITAKKITAKYNSGKLFKIHVKNAKTKKGVNGAKVKLKVYMGKSHYTVTLKANQKGVVKYDTSNMYLGSHIIKMSAADKNIKLSKKAKSKIMITKGTCKVAAPKKIRKHTNLKVRILKKISKEPIKKTKFYVNVDYKTYKLKTDSKGVLKIKTKKLAKGKHELLIILNNDRYDINKKLSFKIR